MFKPSWLITDNDQGQGDDSTNRRGDSHIDTDLRRQAQQATIYQAILFNSSQIQYIVTLNGPIPIQALGYPGGFPWVSAGQMQNYQYPFLNYYHRQTGPSGTLNVLPQQAYTIDPNTGQIRYNHNSVPPQIIQKSKQDLSKTASQRVRLPYQKHHKPVFHDEKHSKPHKLLNGDVENQPAADDRISLAGLLNPSFNTPDEI